MVGDIALDIGEQCDDWCSKLSAENSTPIVDKSTKAEGGSFDSKNGSGGSNDADAGGEGILEV